MRKLGKKPRLGENTIEAFSNCDCSNCFCFCDNACDYNPDGYSSQSNYLDGKNDSQHYSKDLRTTLP